MKRPAFDLSEGTRTISSPPWVPQNSSALRLLLTPDTFTAGSSWVDRSSSVNSYTGTGGVASSVGGIQSVLFDGDEYLSGPALSNFSDGGLMYANALVYATADGPAPMAAGVWASIGGADVPSQGIGYVKVGAENRFNQLYHRVIGGSGWSGVDVEADCDGKWVWVEAGFNGSTVRVRGTDASAVIDTSSNSTSASPHSMAQVTNIGRGVELNNNLFYVGHIAFLAVFRGTPAAAEMAGMRSWVSAGYGIADPGSNLF